MLKKALITGVSGFAGSFLADFLLTNGGYEVSGTYLSEASLVNLKQHKDKLHLFQVNLIHEEETTRVIEQVKPDLIFHLAALPAVGDSFSKPAETIINNVVVELNVLEGIKNTKLFKSRILIVSSADVYGKVAEKDLPIDEDTPFMPTNAYAVSKITQDFLGLQYVISYNMQIIRVRPFNHFGPRQATGFVVADWCKKIAQIEKGQIAPITKVGNLKAKRDFTDVRDMVEAYAILLEKGEVGEVYNVGSGKSIWIEDILQILLKEAKVKISIEKDDLLFRPVDSLDRVCDNSKFVALSGWKPKIPIEKTLKETLDYWRNIV